MNIGEMQGDAAVQTPRAGQLGLKGMVMSSDPKFKYSNLHLSSAVKYSGG